MELRSSILLVATPFFCLASGYSPEEPLLYDQFPPDFVWGAASAAYQVEGGWDADGKGPSIWDVFTKLPGKIDDGSSGDVACDSYHKYREDVGMIKSLGLKSYRFSISWSRILPNGLARNGMGEINQPGVDYYHNLIDELLSAGIEPAVTLYHWDIPQNLEDQGGWLDARVADWFEDYARFCFAEYGDKVKLWITLNEPKETSLQGYGNGDMAPGIVGPGTTAYIAAHNQIRAHARAYHVYKTEFAESQMGKCGITFNVNWAEPKDPNNPEDVKASETHLNFNLGWFAHAIFVDGKYPAVMREKIDAKSIAQGFNVSRLPHFTDEEQEMIRGSSDFLGINFYTSNVVEHKDEGIETIDHALDDDVGEDQDPTWYQSGASWLKVTPWGLRSVLQWANKQYGNQDIYITENGFSSRFNNLDDLQRIYYYKHYLNQLLKAVKQDGIPVKGYYAWSIMDNFEWARGYTEKFGLFAVNMDDPSRNRTAKQSANFYSQIVGFNGFAPSVDPCSNGELLDESFQSSNNPEEELLYDHFPNDFKWGAASAAYQIEGGWNEDGKGESIWDVFTRIPGKIIDGSSGEVACDSYHKYKEDVQLLEAMGANSYRFSIAWSRILPRGEGYVNQAGVDYYHNLINELLAAGIEPAVTLYHWDIPQILEDQGGWLNRNVADWFEQYAKLCFTEFGDKVKIWITLNEPKEMSLQGYGNGNMAPGIVGPGTTAYVVAHNQIRAHARAYRLYKNQFSETQGGRCGITLNVNWAEPRDPNNPEDVEASETHLNFNLGWFAHPIYVDGKYPPVMREKIDAKSMAQGFNTSRLPEFTLEEKEMIRGSSDFFGMNYYTSNVVETKDEGIETIDHSFDDDVAEDQDPNWYGSGSSWLKVTPWGLRKVLGWVHEQYGDRDIFVTENGFSDQLGNLDDLQRIYYYKHYLNQMLKAVKLDGIPVKGYFAWSVMDNFEWAMGYTEKFGLHAVNMSDPGRERYVKQSAKFFGQIIRENGFIQSVGPCSNIFV